MVRSSQSVGCALLAFGLSVTIVALGWEEGAAGSGQDQPARGVSRRVCQRHPPDAQRRHAKNDERAAVDEVLNLSFFVFHTLWIGFNCVGWLWRRTRRWHLATVCLTALSWFGLGIWYGWGYCPCTDWHWQVRARLGYRDPASYTQLLVRELTGVDLPPAQADALTAGVFALVTMMSITLNARDRRRPADRPR